MQKSYRLKAIFFVLALFSLSLFQSSGYARAFFGRTIQLPLQKIAPGDGKILIDFKLPANHEFAKEAPSTVFVRIKNSQILKTAQLRPLPLNLSKLPYSLAYIAQSGDTVLVADLRVHFCDEESKICLSDFIRVKFPVRVEAGAPHDLSFTIPLKSKQHA